MASATAASGASDPAIRRSGDPQQYWQDQRAGREHFRGTDEHDLSGAEAGRPLHPGISRRASRGRASFIAPGAKEQRCHTREDPVDGNDEVVPSCAARLRKNR